MARTFASCVAMAWLAACSEAAPEDTDSADGSGGQGTVTSGTGGQTSEPSSETLAATTSSDTTSSSGIASTTTDSDAATTDGGTTTLAASTDSGVGSDSSGAEGSGDESSSSDGGSAPDPLWIHPNLWYAVEDKLHYVELDPRDGSVVRLVTSTITTELIDGQNGLTMLDDGSLLGSRERAGETQIYHVPEPPTEPSTIEVAIVGVVPDGLRIEGVYTDCWGRVYLMDTGADTSSAEGNRLIRFTGDYLSGDLSYEVITDLEQASVADIDDMSPGIDAEGEITDGRGFAIDSGTVYDFDYNEGTGTAIGMGGTWGIHALGGPLFDDGVARLYVLNRDAELFEADPQDLTLSPVLVTGPAPDGDAAAGWSSLAGPLTECETTFPVPQ